MDKNSDRRSPTVDKRCRGFAAAGFSDSAIDPQRCRPLGAQLGVVAVS